MIGQRLLHFRIVARLGVGGMGEVYRAQDTRLGRQVALKVLPRSLAADPERLRRFEREAKILGALNHPNVAAVYAFETAMPEGERRADTDGQTIEVDASKPVHFLVIELVEGRTLDELIPPGGVTIEKFFELALPLVDGVAAAHERGIVHRDLKPGNIMVSTEDRVKVLDFGIAKLDPASGLDQTDLQTEALTVEGRIVGTVPYMSPEQVKGADLDARSDIFSLGSIFFQMVAGSLPFEGTTAPEVLASVLKDDPPLVTALRPDTPRQLGRIIQHCLAKDPRKRFQSARDLANALSDLEQELSIERQLPATERAERVGTKRNLALWLGAAAVLVVLAAVVFRFIGPSSETRNVSIAAGEQPSEEELSGLAAPLTQLTSAPGLEEWPAWSPSGDLIAFSAEVGGFKNLFIQDLSTGEERRLTATASDEIQAGWSPDGRSLLFVRARGLEDKLKPSDIMGWYSLGGDIWRLDLESGDEEKLIDDAFNPAVAPDGSAILFDADWAGPRRIWRADARGRNPKQVTNDSSEAAVHAQASWSPDGRMIVFRRIQQTSSNIAVMDLETEAVTALTEDDHSDLDPRWSPDGRYIYFSSYRSGGLNLWRIAVTISGAPSGTAQQVTRGPGNDLQATLSPLGDRLAFSVLRLNSDLWRLPVDAMTGAALGSPSEVFASSREDSRGSWYPDASALVFNSDQAGDMNLWRLDLETSTTKQLTGGPGGDFQPKVSPDGSKVVLFSARSGNNDIWTLDLASERLEQLTEDEGLDINPFFSPDGSRIVFQSDRDGRLELWLMNQDGGEQTRLSSVGSSGHFSPWTRDGNSVLFRSGLGDAAKIFSIEVASRELTRLPPISSGAHMSFSPDGRLILDVRGHKTLWVYDLDSGDSKPIFEFDSPSTRIDYPLWSPDGSEVVFDRAEPRGGDIWLLEGLDSDLSRGK